MTHVMTFKTAQYNLQQLIDHCTLDGLVVNSDGRLVEDEAGNQERVSEVARQTLEMAHASQVPMYVHIDQPYSMWVNIGYLESCHPEIRALVQQVLGKHSCIEPKEKVMSDNLSKAIHDRHYESTGRPNYLKMAMLENRPKVFELFLNRGEAITQGDVEAVLTTVIDCYQPELFAESLFKHYTGKLNEECIAYVEKAIHKECPKVAALILSRLSELVCADASVALRSAVEKGYVELVEQLLPKVHQHYKGHLIKLAVEHGFCEIVELLVSKGISMSDKDQLDARLQAISGQQLEILKILLPEGSSIESADLTKCVSLAAKSADWDTIDWLLTGRELSDEGMIEAQHCAEASGNEALFKYIAYQIKSQGVDEENLDALQKIFGQIENVTTVSEIADEVLVYAATSGDNKALELLLKKYPISEEGIDRAIDMAKDWENKDCIQVLQASKEGREL